MSLIELRNVTKRFTGTTEVVTPLEDLDFTIEAGEFVALMGPSGSGKTTLLHLLAGIDRPSEGSVNIDGVDIARLSARALARWRTRHVGYVFQSYNLLPVLTAWENVEVPLLLMKLTRADRAAKISLALAAVGLTDRAHHLPRQLSGGQQQRVAIARAIVADPTLLLADEPTGNLDRKVASATLELLQRLHREFGKTLVMVTHDPAAAQYASRIVELDKGQLVAQGESHA
jgi:putative ABC transport system ATP-binding protein